MIFVGDVAIAPNECIKFIGFSDLIKSKPWCLNFEGPIAIGGQPLEWGVCNSQNWLDSFEGFSIGPTFLANNHIQDLPNGIHETKRYLDEAKIESFGAGQKISKAQTSTSVRSGVNRYDLIGAGWGVVGCGSAGASRPGVAPMNGQYLLTQAKELMDNDPSTRIVIVLHTNYEFEKYPQPGHRKLAMDLIDHGAHAVICHHPHIVGPVERYKGRAIAYSLGNWAFSYGKHFGGKLRFPETSFPQLAIELGEDADVAHYALFEPPNKVVYDRAELVGSDDFSLAPEFEGFSHKDYSKWFRKHRLKRKALPIYYDYQDSLVNRTKDSWVFLRQRMIDIACRVGLKSLRRR